MPLSRQEKNQLERERRKGDQGAVLRERDRLKKKRDREGYPANMRFIQALREFLGLSPLPGVPER
jgi:hypothetical protein